MADSNFSYYQPSSTRQKNILQPTPAGSVSLICGIFLSFVLLDPNALPSEIARAAAIPLGIAFLVSLGFDSTRGWGNLFRTDLVCLSGLYFFTLFEFLFPQDRFNERLTSDQTVAAIEVILIGFVGLVVGRHFSLLKPVPKKWLDFSGISDRALFRLFLIATFFGYFYMLWSVNFNILEAMNEMLDPRFTQPWLRGRYGGVTSLFTELSLFRYAIPPITGILWNRRQNIKTWQLILIILVFIFTLYEGFTSGTRKIFLSYLAGFLGGYFLTLKEIRLWKIALPVGLTSYIVLFATRHMRGFGNIGLRNYIEFGTYEIVQAEETLFVDYNLWSIGKIVDSMPSQYDFLGWELIWVFATKPIPRILWPGKPEELSVSIEQIVGAQGWTVASTYIGEAYMLGGVVAVIVVSFILGATSNWWTRITTQQSSGYAVAVGALGFFAAALTMRSLAFFTTNILPIVALIFFAKVIPSWIGAKQK